MSSSKQMEMYKGFQDEYRKYDSDEDLPIELRQKLKQIPEGHPEGQRLRRQYWESQPTFNKLKKALKSGIWGDKAEKK